MVRELLPKSLLLVILSVLALPVMIVLYAPETTVSAQTGETSGALTVVARFEAGVAIGITSSGAEDWECCTSVVRTGVRAGDEVPVHVLLQEFAGRPVPRPFTVVTWMDEP